MLEDDIDSQKVAPTPIREKPVFPLFRVHPLERLLNVQAWDELPERGGLHDEQNHELLF